MYIYVNSLYSEEGSKYRVESSIKNIFQSGEHLSILIYIYIYLLYEYRDLREVFGWNKIRISLHTIFFTCEKTRISALIGRTIFSHMWKKSYQRFDWLTFSYPKKFNTCSQANVNMESDFVNLLRRDLWYFVYKKSRKIMKKYICGFIKMK